LASAANLPSFDYLNYLGEIMEKVLTFLDAYYKARTDY